MYCRVISPCRTVEQPVVGRGLGHVTQFRNFGTHLITFEPNLVQRWRTDPFCLGTIKRKPQLAGWLDVIRRYCIKSAKSILKLFRPTGSHIRPLRRYPIPRGTHSAGAIYIYAGQWLKQFCEAGGGAHLTTPGWSRPHIHSTLTNLALFGHKITLYRFNQGAHTIAGGSNRSRGLSPLPPHFNHCTGVETLAIFYGNRSLSRKRCEIRRWSVCLLLLCVYVFFFCFSCCSCMGLVA